MCWQSMHLHLKQAPGYKGIRSLYVDRMKDYCHIDRSNEGAQNKKGYFKCKGGSGRPNPFCI